MADASGCAAKLWLRAFGVGGVGRIGDERSLAIGMKAHAMLVYLAEASPRPVSRDALVDLLWENVAPQQGKGSLRQEIRRIKRAVGDDGFDNLMEVTDQALALRLDHVDYDVRAAVNAAGSDDPEDLAVLLTISDGDFLASNAARAEHFQQWATERREFLKDMILAALARLGFLDVAAGRLDRAQVVADRMATIDPLHEKGHEIMIRAHLASGRRGKARAHYERFRATMIRELGAEPDEELKALAAPETDCAHADPGRAPARPVRRGGDRPVVAVVNATPRRDEEQAYLADGVAVQLVSNLSRSGWIRVTPLNLSTLSALSADVDRYQRDLRDAADYVLRVHVAAAEERVAITATLSRVADGATVFSDQMEDDFADLLALQRRVALRIASVFEPQVVGAETQRAAEAEWSDDEDDVDHWRLLMRATWLFWRLTPKTSAEARQLLERALELKPSDPPTLCMLAFSNMVEAWSDWTKDVDGAVRQARRWAERAVRADPNDGWAHFTLGFTNSTHTGLAQAKASVSHALELAPSLVIALGELSRLHAFDGETASAASRADEALALSPYDPQAGLWIRSKAIARWIDRDLEKALRLIDYGAVVRPGWFQNDVLRAAILVELGREEEGRAAFDAVRARIGDYSFASLRLGHPFSDPKTFERFVAALNRAGWNYPVPP